MLTNDPNIAKDLVKLLICPLCNALCEIVITENSETTCIACGKNFSTTDDANTVIVAEDHLLKNYQKLTKDDLSAYIENE